MKTRESISAGGVAYRIVDGANQIAIIRTSKEGRWQLPKGIIDPGETVEQTALREVREEAGIDCTLEEKIDSIDYWYVDRWSADPVRIHKYVHFFLMRYLCGDITDHDNEVEEVRWVNLDEAAKLLSFQAEKKIVDKGKTMIS